MDPRVGIQRDDAVRGGVENGAQFLVGIAAVAAHGKLDHLGAGARGLWRGDGFSCGSCFDGEWDGLIIAQLFVGKIRGVERCFVLGRDLAGVNGLWEILRETDDQKGDEPTQVLETRMLFGDSSGTLKNIRRCDLQFSDIRGGLDVRVYFRPEKHPYWIRWDEFTVEAPGTRPWGRVHPQIGRAPV